jgi:hypothetical protein
LFFEYSLSFLAAYIAMMWFSLSSRICRHVADVKVMDSMNISCCLLSLDALINMFSVHKVDFNFLFFLSLLRKRAPMSDLSNIFVLWSILLALFVVSSICFVIAIEVIPGIIFSVITSFLFAIYDRDDTTGTFDARSTS